MDEKKETVEGSYGSSIDMAEVKKRKGWVVALVASITLARISNGLFLSITGPTLLFLAENTDSSVSQVSSMFSGRSVGMLTGAICFGAVSNRFPDYKPLFTLGIGLGIHGIVMILTPFMTSLAGLVTITMVGGLMFGYINSGLQAVYLKLWGPEKSRPYLQSVHFGFSIGALLAPIIATPFLVKADAAQEAGTSCPNEEDILSTTPLTLLNATEPTSPPVTEQINPVSWSFIIIGVYTIFASLLLCGLALCKIEEKVASHNIEKTESRPEEPIKDLWMFFIPLCFFYFCLVSSEMLYQSYIFSVSLCSELEFSAEQASLLTSVFWTGFAIGRGTGIITSKYLKPATIIILDLIGTTSIITLMCIWGEQSAILTWIVTFIHGLSIATMYSAGVSWTSEVTNMAGTYIFVFSIGGTVGGFSMLPAGGVLFDKEPFSVMYLILGCCVFNIIFFILMNVIWKWRIRRGIGYQPEQNQQDQFKGNSNAGFEIEESKYTEF